MFLVHLSQKHLKASTIRTYISAIAFVHKIKQLTDHSQSLLVTKTLQGIANKDKQNPSQPLQPITKDLLHRLVDTLPSTHPSSPYYQALLKALFLLAYHACMRAGEAVLSSHDHHTLSYNDITRSIHLGKPVYNINFSTYKHSRNAATMILPSADTPSYCPVLALDHYLSLRGSHPGKLFVNITRQPVDRSFFADSLKSSLAYLRIPHHSFNTHSFRIGRATQLASDQTPDTTIQNIGRWRSTAYQSYIRRRVIPLPQ